MSLRLLFHRHHFRDPLRFQRHLLLFRTHPPEADDHSGLVRAAQDVDAARVLQILIIIIAAFRCSHSYVPDTHREETNALMHIVDGAIRARPRQPVLSLRLWLLGLRRECNPGAEPAAKPALCQAGSRRNSPAART